MVELGVGEDRDLGIELEQRAVALVGLDHDPLPAPPARAETGPRQLGADHEGRVKAGAAQGVGGHRRGRRLAVRAGDGQAALERRDLGEQIGPVQLAARRHALGILGRDRGRVDDLGAGGHVLGGVADPRLDPVLAQPGRVGRLGAIRAGDPGPERAGDQGQAAHAGAADADEVQLPL